MRHIITHAKRFSLCFLVLCLALRAFQAKASYWYTDIKPDVTIDGEDSYILDLNGDGSYDFQIYNTYYSSEKTDYIKIQSLDVNGQVNYNTANTYVNPSLTGQTNWVEAYNFPHKTVGYYNCFSGFCNFTGGIVETRRAIPVRWKPNGTDYVYGWIAISIENSLHNGYGYLQFTVYDYGYEDDPTAYFSLGYIPSQTFVNFSANTTTPTTGQAVTFTAYTSTVGTINSYAWDFGAGANPATATTVGPHNVVYATTGAKTVSLTINGTVVESKTAYINVSVGAPTSDFSASTTTPNTGQTVTFTANTTGAITSYAWNFGSGASPATANTVGPHNVTYSTTGAKTVTLTINGSIPKTKTNYITVSAAPVTSDFSASTTTPGTGQTVTFTANTTGVITSYAWNFGSGASPATANTVGPHNVTYSTTGAKTVSLTVNGSVPKTKTNYITVSAATVTSNFSANNTTPTTAQAVTFTANTTGAITSWAWDFGAGASPATANTVGPHNVTYSTTGAKTVKLTVNGSVVNSKAAYINVQTTSASPVYKDHFTYGFPTNITGGDGYSFSSPGNNTELQIVGDGTPGSYSYMQYTLYDNYEMEGSLYYPFEVDNSGSKKLYIRVKSTVANTELNIQLQDAYGAATNGVNQSFNITTSYPSSAYMLDFSTNTQDMYNPPCTTGSPCDVDFTRINRILIGINPADGGFNGTVTIDYISLGADLPITTGLTSNEKVGQAFTIYPNPTTGNIFLEGIEAGSTAEIFNPMGQKMMSVPVAEHHPLDCSTLSSGTYHLKLTNPAGMLSVKPLVIR